MWYWPKVRACGSIDIFGTSLLKCARFKCKVFGKNTISQLTNCSNIFSRCIKIYPSIVIVITARAKTTKTYKLYA